MLSNQLTHILRRRRNSAPILKGYTSSAVLVPLIRKRGEYRLLFTLRTDQVRDHKNQISFPGGVYEKSDGDLLETALRESQEELGLPPEKVLVVGSLPELYTPTGYRITPFVGVIPSPVRLSPNPREIKQLIEVPLKHLLKPANMRLQAAEFFDRQFDVPFFSYKNHTIWGATGKITQELVDLMLKHAVAV
jgi:8-oxo-dGTP pyrophosphatase MutT (NUDIX family)